MKKKLISILLCAALTASVLSGCGGNSDNSSDSSNTSSSEDTSSSDAAQDDTQDAEAGDDNVASAETTDLEPVTLHFIFFGDKKSATDEVWDAIADYTRDTLNCDYDVQFVASGDFKDKLQVKSAAGESWDLNFDSDWNCYYSMVAKDAYMALDDLLPVYAPDLYKTYEEYGLLEAAKHNGHIVSLPWTMTMNNRPFFQWRGDLAEAAGIEVDKDNLNTYEDVDKLLHQLQEAYPDKYLMEAVTVVQTPEDLYEVEPGFYIDLKDPTCQIIPAEDTQCYKDMAKYAEKWQSEGIIRKDILIDKLDGNSLINEGKLITKFGTHEFSTCNRAWVEEGAHWDYTELGPDGIFANRTPLANAMCIPETSENPERTLMFLNMLETDQTLYDMVQYGIEGVTYVLDGEAAVYPDGMDSASSNYMEWGGQWGLWKPQFMRPTDQYSDGFWVEEANYAASSDKNVVSPLEGFSFDSSAVSTEYMQRTQIYNDAHKLINVGLAGNWEDAVAKLSSDSKAAGLDTLVAEYQRQIDEFLANKK